jgi:hypothetical protein
MLLRQQAEVVAVVDITVVLAHLGLAAVADLLIHTLLWRHQSQIPKASKQVTDLHHSPI